MTKILNLQIFKITLKILNEIKKKVNKKKFSMRLTLLDVLCL